MALLQETNEGRRFLTYAEGKLREKVADGSESAESVLAKHQNAVLREGTTPSGEPFSKWEIPYPGIRAFITSVELSKGKYGKQVLVHMKDGNDEEFIIALTANSRGTGVKFLLALPNIDMTKEVTIKAFADFKKDGKDIFGGISIQQGGVKIADAFWDHEKKEQLLGMPKPEVDKRTKEVDYDTYWPIRDKWLQDYLLDNNFMTYNDGASTEVPAATTDEEF